MKKILAMNWQTITNNLNQKGYSVIDNVLSEAECKHLSGLYSDDYLYRNIVNMRRYRFGLGEYKYFNYPLPPAIQMLREILYAPLATIANEWMRKLDLKTQFPAKHQDFIVECQARSQTRPTPLMLRYETGGFNTLHQDMYGEIYFPFQVVFVLTQAGRDHAGGEFVLTEQVPRAQSRVEVLQPNHHVGDGRWRHLVVGMKHPEVGGFRRDQAHRPDRQILERPGADHHDPQP